MIVLWEKIKTWIIALGSIIVTIVGFWLYGREQGKKDQKQAEATEASEQTQKAQETRSEVNKEVQNLPDAPAQKLDTPIKGTAAEELSPWLRD
jgi:hypothetical protein